MPFHFNIYLFSDDHNESGSGGSAEKEHTSGDGSLRSHWAQQGSFLQLSKTKEMAFYPKELRAIRDFH